MRWSACVLSALAVVSGFGSALLQAGEAAEAPVLQVKVEEIRPVDIPVRLEYPGRAAGYREVEVRAQVSGILQERTYQEGGQVKQGQILFRIDPRQYAAALARAKAALAQEQARLRQAERDLKRVRTMADKGFASERERDNAISTFEQTKANLAAAEAEVQSRQIDLDYTTVRAPISGITSREARSEGSLVIAGDPSASLLTQLTQLDPIYVNFALPQDSEGARLRQDFASGKLANADRSTLSVEVLLNDGSLYPQQGRVDFTDSLVDKGTGSVSARVLLPNPQQKLLPGQFVRIRISGMLRLHAISIPERAVAQQASGPYVFVVDADGVAHQRPVVLGSTTGGRWLVESGLQAGDRVVVEGGQKLHADERVDAAVVDSIQAHGLIEEVRR
ncbi:efflux RND transporter periplasmic adaptor subunit [Pseudomonas sp. N040]|uniref:efflux RND transporter periplasmic adaptor subunit n=1 Tax=Pseudomonas sp. N040 TaxID=2785325 RepID=UPI0018A2D488|nr:efflux RND transporter periplasmic adaptor subunit [Pseudomonas sp. N040]MBF7731687.1 efflux RND transporter periplasmic adaptor subunit [Pseudomonas sp. N040]MBW7015331.1 efflux RND transporter periplasmic adaptor subunit [Pseudomonas sp. N040]